MKKVLFILFVSTLAFVFVACAKEKTEDFAANDAWNYEDAYDWSADAADDLFAEDAAETEKSKHSNTTPEWREFLKEYEDWVDEYIEILKKYSADPSDMSILTDYMEMVSELTEWSSKTEEMQDELEQASPAEVAEYASELARIAAKIAKAAY